MTQSARFAAPADDVARARRYADGYERLGRPNMALAQRQLLLPVVLPRFRMLPDCLIEFVPVERTFVPCDRAASTGPREGA